MTAHIQCIDYNNINALGVGLDSSSNIPPSLIDNLKNVTKEKCLKVSGGNQAYEAIERAVDELKNCTIGLIDTNLLQNEIEEAKPNGELDIVFNKYVPLRLNIVQSQLQSNMFNV